MARKLTGIRRRRGGWRVTVRVRGHLYTKQFTLTTPVSEMRAWRDAQALTFGGTWTIAGSFGADITTYLGRVSAMPSYHQRAAHLELWARALGRDRPRRTITPTEIDRVLQSWLQTCAPATVRKRRTALQSLFVTLDGKLAANPVRASANPKPPKPEARGLDYQTIERILAAMPGQASIAPGAIPRPSLAKLRLAVIAYTGIPPGLLQTVTPPDLSLTAGTVRLRARRKGAGAPARTLPLTAEGRAAFAAFHAANAYGRFAVESMNRSFKRAAKRIGLDPTTVHAYDLRHSYGMELYRRTRDLATVGRLLGHSPGSTITARYAQGANAAVDAAAVAAFSAGLEEQRQAVAPVQERADQSPGKVTRARKSPRRLRRVS